MTNEKTGRRLRSQDWFDNRDHIDMAAIYLERFMNYGITPEELRSGKPVIGIAQSGSDLTPCNRHHIELAKRVRDGIRDAGGIPIEFPTHPIFENCKRPTAALDRNLAYLGLVEILYGYPLDGVVLTTGCDKTTPAQIMAAATVDIPAIALPGGPMLNGSFRGERTGSGTIVWKARQMMAAGEIDYKGFVDLVASSAPSAGHCNTMGTASTMNALAEAMGMTLPGAAAIPAPYRDRYEMAYLTGKRINFDNNAIIGIGYVVSATPPVAYQMINELRLMVEYADDLVEGLQFRMDGSGNLIAQSGSTFPSVPVGSLVMLAPAVGTTITSAVAALGASGFRNFGAYRVATSWHDVGGLQALTIEHLQDAVLPEDYATSAISYFYNSPSGVSVRFFLNAPATAPTGAVCNQDDKYDFDGSPATQMKDG